MNTTTLSELESSSVDVTVCITVWNSLDTLRKTLSQLETEFEAWELSYQVFVYDQASQDKTGEFLTKLAKEQKLARIFLSDKNLGQCRSRNTMCRTTVSPYVVFLDGDIVPIPGSIQAMLNYVIGHPGCNGIHYDIRNDTPFPEKSTPAENPITMHDVEPINLLYFHYALYEREFLNKVQLPEFPPFDGPGWGMEEDVALLLDPKATTLKIKHRTFFHDNNGRSVNSLKDELPVTRAKRFAVWALLRQVETSIVAKCFGVNGMPQIRPFLWEAKIDTLMHKAAMAALMEFVPIVMYTKDNDDGDTVKRRLLFEMDKPHYRGKDKVLMIPTDYSPVWLLANRPAVKCTTEGVPWLYFGSVKWLKDLDVFVKEAALYSSVMTQDPEVMLLCCLLGIPCEMVDANKVKATDESEEQLYMWGIDTVMGLEKVLAFRKLWQSVCRERVILPLVTMLFGSSKAVDMVVKK